MFCIVLRFRRDKIYPIKPHGDRDMKKFVLLALSLALLAGCDNSPEAKEKQVAKRAIKLCWEDYNKKSLDEASKRFIAGACEKLEGDYKTKYNSNP